MTDVMEIVCWNQPCQWFTLWNTNVRGFLFYTVFSRNIFAFQHLIRKISPGQSRIIFLLCESGFFFTTTDYRTRISPLTLTLTENSI